MILTPASLVVSLVVVGLTLMALELYALFRHPRPAVQEVAGSARGLRMARTVPNGLPTRLRRSPSHRGHRIS